jgi:hypothetical protein
MKGAMDPKLFYLFARRPAADGKMTEAVFFKTAGQDVAEGLCGLFKKEYGGADGGTEFRWAAADTIASQEQVLLDESLGWLEMYDDPDPGVYDPEPDRETMTVAQYGVRARAWEDLLREKTGRPEAGGGERAPGGNGGEPLAGAGVEGMPEEDRRNAMLGLLMLLAQAYYRMLESAIGMASTVSALDLELNHSYLWTVKNLRNLLANSPELKDFPEQFKPAVPNLYPSTIRDMDWEDGVGPDAEGFLSAAQEYVMEKGIYDPEEGSPAWCMIALFRPGVEKAVQRAAAYHERMSGAWRRMMGRAAQGTSCTEGAEAPKAEPPARGAATERAAAGGGGSGGAVITINGKKERIYHISLFPLVITLGAESIEIKLKWETAEPEVFDLREKVRALAKRFEAGGVNLTGLKHHPDRKERGIGPELAACLEGQLEFTDGHKMRVFCRTRPHTPEEEGVVFQEKMRGAGRRGAKEEEAGAETLTVRKGGTGEFVRGRLRCSADFKDVWLGDKHYDLRTRPKAGLCIRYLFENNAFDATSAKHLVDEINPFVRGRGGYESLKFEEVKIQHYFNDPKKELPELCKQLIGAVHRKGRYFLKVE